MTSPALISILTAYANRTWTDYTWKFVGVEKTECGTCTLYMVESVCGKDEAALWFVSEKDFGYWCGEAFSWTSSRLYGEC